MKIPELSTQQRSRRVLVYGGISAFISALFSGYYLSSVLFYPVFLFLLVLVIRHAKRTQAPLPALQLLGIGLAIGAMLMPLAGYVGITFISDLDPRDTGWNHHPIFYLYISALASLVLSLAGTGLWGRRGTNESPPV
ncbi:MAG: hypothetical protein ABIS18_00480 [Actinomycetota bacterium]